MNNRDYNVFFNTHTVSGIVISIGLYVIFLAGGFALFLENINHWEANEPAESAVTVIDYDRVLAQVEAEGYAMHGRDMFINNHHGHISVFSQPLSDSTLQGSQLSLLPDSVARGNINLELDGDTYAVAPSEEEAQEAALGDFLYDLHFFRQIPVVGIYLAGLVSVFFLFAIITGVIVHWNKIFSFFFTFRLKASLKNLWTDAHTALGVIGLPFQFMYAVTGAIFGLVILIFLPYAQILYGGDQQAMFEEVYPAFFSQQFETKGYTEAQVSINKLVEQSVSKIPTEHVEFISVGIKNYHDQNAHVGVTIGTDLTSHFFNTTEIAYRLSDGQMVHEVAVADNPPYVVGVVDFVHRIHFGNYGGYFIRVLYFLMALVTCFVIISGVMVWLKARDKKKYEAKQQYNTNVGAIYLGACLGLFPAIALMFILTKTFPAEMAHRFGWISWLFLAFWVGYTVYAYFVKNYFTINRNALLLAGVMGLLIPVFNGLHSGLWLWQSLPMGYPDSFFVDLAWLLTGALTTFVALRLTPQAEPAKATRKKQKLTTIRVSKPIHAVNPGPRPIQ